MKHEADLARTSAVSDEQSLHVRIMAYRHFRTIKLLMSSSGKSYHLC